MELKCFNCKRVIAKKLGARGMMPDKKCLWCGQHIAKRQSMRTPRERKK